jgi:hypothetical protein
MYWTRGWRSVRLDLRRVTRSGAVIEAYAQVASRLPDERTSEMLNKEV